MTINYNNENKPTDILEWIEALCAQIKNIKGEEWYVQNTDTIKTLKTAILRNQSDIGDLETLNREILDGLSEQSLPNSLVNVINFIYKNSGGKYNVKQLKASVGAGAKKVQISWVNPQSKNIGDILVFVSMSEDISNQPYDYCVANCTKIVGNFSTATDAVNKHDMVLQSNDIGKMLYVRVFVDYGGEYSNGSSVSQVLRDIDPTGPVRNVKVTQNIDNTATLSWNNPIDEDLGSVVIRMKEGEVPSSNFDGDKIFEGINTQFKTPALDRDKTYVFRFFVYDTSGNINDSIEQQVTLAMDHTPPSEVSGVTMLSGFSNIKFKWTDSVESDWEKTIVRRNNGKDNPVVSIEAGTPVITLTKSEKNKYRDIYYIDNNLSSSMWYTYTFFTIDKFGNLSNGTSYSESTSSNAIPEVSGLDLVNINNGKLVQLTFLNPGLLPQGLSYLGREVFYTTNDEIALEDLTRDACTTTSGVENLTNGAGTGSGMKETLTIPGTSIGERLTCKIFVKFDNNGTVIYSAGSVISILVKDDTPLTDIKDLQALSGDTMVTLSWTNPSTDSDSDFDRIEIFRRIGTYPTGLEESEKIHTSTEQNLNNVNKFEDVSVLNRIVYYYLIVSYDKTGNVNKNAKITCMPNELPILGFEYNAVDGTYKKLGIAREETPEQIAKLYPYNKIRRILVDSSNKVTYLNKTDSSKTELDEVADLTKNMFSRIPKIYYKYEYIDGRHRWYIAENQYEGFELHQAFNNGSVQDHVDIGVFDGQIVENKLKSVANIEPTIDKAYADYKTAATANGANYQQFDINKLDLLRVLFICQYGTFDVQKTLGEGSTTLNTTGKTLSLGDSNGAVDGVVSLYGVENPFGGSHKVIEGIRFIKGKGIYKTNNDYGSFKDHENLGTYTKLSTFDVSTETGFIKDIFPTKDVFIGNDMTSSSTEGLTDMQTGIKDNGNIHVLCVGGTTNPTSGAGLFNNEIVDIDHLSVDLPMELVQETDTFKEYKVAIDINNYNDEFKKLSSIEDVSTQTDAKLRVNQSVVAKITGRLVHY